MSANPIALRIKQMILNEEIKPGERLTEEGIAAKLNISRTPVRNAIPLLASEGLLESVGRRGYRVKRFGEFESWQALDLRGLMEGYAAAQLASKGLDDAVLAQLDECLQEGDRIFEKRHLDADDEGRYGDMNERFHKLILDACDSPLVQTLLDRINQAPFVAPSVVMFDEVGLNQAYDYLFRAHGVHHAIVEAIRERDPHRAEALFREHARQQRFSMFVGRAKQQSDVPTVTKQRVCVKE